MIDSLEFHEHGFISLQPILNLIDSLIYESDFNVLYYGFDLVSWLDYKLLKTKQHSKFKVNWKAKNFLNKLFCY